MAVGSVTFVDITGTKPYMALLTFARAVLALSEDRGDDYELRSLVESLGVDLGDSGLINEG